MKRAELLSIIMHDIGLPVVQGIIDVARDKSEEQVVEEITQLLKKTIHNADEIKSLLDLLEDEEKDVSVRLNLATLSCHIIAAHYQKNKRLPTEAELKRSVSSIDLLLTFSENYIPMERLDGVYPEHLRGLSPLSRTVANLVYLKYYVPLVDAVSEFSFGQPETKMIQDVSEKLRQRAADLTDTLMGDSITKHEKKSSELLILSSLIPLYCACHNKEKSRIMALNEDVRNQENNDAQIKNIWSTFEKRIAMLTLLAKHIMPDHFTDEDIAAIENLFTDDAGFVAIDTLEDEMDAQDAEYDDDNDGDDDEEEDKKPVSPPKKAASKKKANKKSAKKSKSSGPMGFYSSNDGASDDDDDSDGDSDDDDGKDSASSDRPMAFFKSGD
tara:strand:- start:7523 stop:8674 length:1152 start_codon:yes stop_codon:yes gene_type:complete